LKKFWIKVTWSRLASASSPEITGPLTVDLRAERSGIGTGRLYTITAECRDASGNLATRSVQVSVPHNQ